MEIEVMETVEWETVELEGRKWMIVPDAAKLAGVQNVTIYQNIHRDRLSSRVSMSRIVVPIDEVVTLWPQEEPEPEPADG